MARQKGIIKLKGTLGGITFYQRNGQDFLKEASAPDKNRILNDPAYARTRENNQEFGAAATIGKALRVGLVQEFDEMADSNATARIVKLIKQVISRDVAGVRGQRLFAPVVNKNMFVNFPFNESVSLDSKFLAPYTAAVNAGRNQVTITIPDFNTGNFVHAPAGSTHFRIINLISVLSQYSFNTTIRKYEPADAANNSRNAFAASGFLAIGPNVGAVTTIVAAITPAPTLPATSALISCIGIEFYQQVGTQFYLLSSDNAMKIQNVY
jgi:hypothetical protein